MPPRMQLYPVVVALVCAAGLVACGGDDDSSSSAGAGGGGGSDAAVTEAKQVVAEAMEAPTEWKGPDSSPPAAKDKTLYVISCGATIEGCVRQTNGSREAAKAIGWKSKAIVTNGSLAEMAAGLDQAMNAKADAAVVISVPNVQLKAQLAKAEKAGMPVILLTSGSDTPEIGPDFEGGYFADIDIDSRRQGEIQASWIIDQTDGEAKIGIITDEAFNKLNILMEGFDATFGKCSGCEVVQNLNVPVPVLTKEATPTVAQFLRSNPDANYMLATYDGSAIFAAQAIRQTNNKGKVPLIGANGSAPNLQLIRDGDIQVADVADPLEWVGWAGVDQANRALNGEPPAPEWGLEGGGLPMRLLTEENVPPEGQSWTGDFDFKAKFKELWGVE